MAATKFIQGAISRPGALTAAVGGKPSDNLAKVRDLAANGTPLQKRQASFYLNVLAKVGGRGKKAKAKPPDELATARNIVKRNQAAEESKAGERGESASTERGESMKVGAGKGIGAFTTPVNAASIAKAKKKPAAGYPKA